MIEQSTKEKQLMGQKSAQRIANDHFMVAGKMYHWDKNEQGRFQAHSGLGKDCELYKEERGLE
jgi:galactose mutarotase-like enzyme